MREYIVLKQLGRGDLHIYGPISAPNAEIAIERLATGKGGNERSEREHRALDLEPPRYVATERGRYFAIDLHTWQAGAFDYTKTRGTEEVPFGG